MSDDSDNDMMVSRRAFLGVASTGALGSITGLDTLRQFLDWPAKHLMLRASPMPFRMYLTGISWIAQEPVGVRLRWLYPAHIPSSTKYVGFPDSVRIERADIGTDDIFPGNRWPIDVGSHARCSQPIEWWRNGLLMVSASPAVFRPGSASAQAVSFVFR